MREYVNTGKRDRSGDKENYCTSLYGACDKVKLSTLTDIIKSIIASYYYLFYLFISHAVHSLNTAEKVLRYNAAIMNDLLYVE